MALNVTVFITSLLIMEFLSLVHLKIPLFYLKGFNYTLFTTVHIATASIRLHLLFCDVCNIMKTRISWIWMINIKIIRLSESLGTDTETKKTGVPSAAT